MASADTAVIFLGHWIWVAAGMLVLAYFLAICAVVAFIYLAVAFANSQILCLKALRSWKKSAHRWSIQIIIKLFPKLYFIHLQIWGLITAFSTFWMRGIIFTKIAIRDDNHIICFVFESKWSLIWCLGYLRGDQLGVRHHKFITFILIHFFIWSWKGRC